MKFTSMNSARFLLMISVELFWTDVFIDLKKYVEL
jgi:hypothetical protein